jgi:hemolysin III
MVACSKAMVQSSIQQKRPYGPRELAADKWIHISGITAGVVGAVILVATVATGANIPIFFATLAYAVGLVTMLCCSAAYNLAPPGRAQQLLRRIDHAAIFLMIAGTYTPLTTRHLDGVWFYAIISVVWAGALAGAVLKLALPHRFERYSLVAYLGLGWVIVIALGPLIQSTDLTTLLLIGAGGVLYSIGTGFYAWAALPFQNAIWHAFVLAAAACHYAAVWLSVVLEPVASKLN